MLKFKSFRSPITCVNGCAASSQPAATIAGLNILQRGGNAADAAVAMAAVLALTEPCSTGLGGDAFCLFYGHKEGKVMAMNASGRSPASLTLDALTSKGYNNDTGYPLTHGLSVTVPGAADGWIKCVEKFGSGKFPLNEIFAPAISLARNGFPVAGPFTSQAWKDTSGPLCSPENIHGKDLLIACNENGQTTYRTPAHGEIFKNPKLANVIETLAENGKEGFYKGWIAQSIATAVKKFGGVMDTDDLSQHETTFEDPISIAYKGVRLWETAPNSQGIVALIALNILKNFDLLKQYGTNSWKYWHILIEALKLAFADAIAFCSDPNFNELPIADVLKDEYGKKRASRISIDSVIDSPRCDNTLNFGYDTVYFTAVDKDRNACSFINSNYKGFGTGIVPENCGFTLQNRAANFNLKCGHPNVVEPKKRPYHTIIPGMLTDDNTGELLVSFGVMGGFMQPQGHVQVLLNMIEFGMNPQEALDQPRIRINPFEGPTDVEETLPKDIIENLRKKGHKIQVAGTGSEKVDFGKGQVIALKPIWDPKMDTSNGVLWAGCDPRSDGIAAGY